MAVARTLDHNSDRCRVIREIFDRLGDKWTLLIVSILSQGPQRFTILKYAAEGISQRMLPLTLHKLERDGIVERTVLAEVPSRVEYQLSSLGQTLVGPATALADWAISNNEAIAAHQQRFDRRFHWPPRRSRKWSDREAPRFHSCSRVQVHRECWECRRTVQRDWS